MKSKKRLWRNSELLLLQYPLAQDIIHKQNISTIGGWKE